MFPSFTPDSPEANRLVRGKMSQKALHREYVDRPVEVLPGVFSDDMEFLTFKDILSKELTDKIPDNVDEDGRVYGTGVRSNFLGLRHVSGYGMNPATYPIMDNNPLRESRGLLNHFKNDSHRALFRALVMEFFADIEPQPLKIREGTSTTFPFFEKRMAMKEQLAREALRNAQKAGELFQKGDFWRAWDAFHIGGANYVVYRDQASDGVTYENGEYSAKAREVADLEYALSAGASGHLFTSEKSLEGRVNTPKGFFAMRRRSAYASPGSLNFTLGPIASGVRESIYAKFAHTYHHRTREETQSHFRDWKFIIMADVTQHDQFWPHFILDEVCSVLREMGFADWWIELYFYKSKLPMYVTGVGIDMPNVLMGDPGDPNVRMGLPSGTMFTDIEGTLFMSFVYMVIQLDHTAPHLWPSTKRPDQMRAFVQRYLRGELPIRLKDKSDDGALGWTDPTLVPAAKELLEKMKKGESVSPYILVTEEKGGAYLGNVLLYPETKDPSGLVLIGNLNNLVINQFSPEYSVQSNVKDRSKVKRPFPGLGWESIAENYGSAPAYREVMDIIESCWRRIYGVSYTAMRNAMLERDQRAVLEYVGKSSPVGFDLSPIDREVLENPSKLAYKYLPEDVSPAVLSMLFKGLTLDETEPFFNSIVR